MNIKEQLQAERKALLDQMENIVRKIKSDGRESGTTDELRNIDAKDARRREIDEEIASIDADEALIKRLSASWSAGGAHGGMDWREFDMDGIKSGLSESLARKGAFAFNMPFTKAAITAGSLDLPSTGEGISEAPPGDSAVALRELFTVQTVTVPLVRYYKVGLGSGADIVAEGALKPELSSSITPVDAELSKIAVRFTYTDEMAEDAEFLVRYVGREATRAVMRRENTLVLDTLDAETAALTDTGTAADVIDILARAIGTAQATNGLTPTRLLAHPSDVAAIRTLKASGSGEYAIDPLGGAPTAVHGVPITASPAVTAGTMYLTTPGFGVFYAHTSGLRVESGFADGDWERNRASTRVEERVLPTIQQPSLLTRITLTEE